MKNHGNRRPTFGRKGKRRPFSAKRRPTIAKIFQLNSNKSGTNRDISLKFSAIVHHMSGLNLFKNFGHNFYVNQDIALKFSAIVHHMSTLN